MADRRMIWKSVSQSKKVNSLSQSAALLWTWCIPWFDRDGYMEAEPDFLKYNVVPRRRELDESSIKLLVEEIISSGLWIPFTDEEGKMVVKEKEFNEHQHHEYKKESKSKWEGKQLKSASSRRVVEDNSSRDKIKVVKEEISKRAVKEEESMRETKTENDNGCHLKPETKKAISELLIKYPRFPITKVIGMALSLKKHPAAILYAIQETTKDCKGFNPEQYFNTILDRTSGNYYESEAVKKHEELKKGMPNSIKAILKETLK